MDELTSKLYKNGIDIAIITETGVKPEWCTQKTTAEATKHNGYNILPALKTDNKAGHVLFLTKLILKIDNIIHHGDTGRILKIQIDIGVQIDIIGITRDTQSRRKK